MRDLVVLLIVFGAVPIILTRPWIGILVWSWLGYMNPHRLTWGFAYHFPFAQIIGLVTLGAMLMSKEKKHFPITGLTVVWMLWAVWMNITTLFAIFPDQALPEWDRAMKIQLFAIVTVLLTRSKERLTWLVWVIVASIGFYGVKGGIFSLATGGQYLVWGPEGSFIQGNNAIGLALVMIMPLMFFLFTHNKNRYIRLFLVGSLALSSLAVLTTHSRGALLAIGAMGGMMWLKSRHKLLLGLVFLACVPILWQFMPDEWHQRMSTISTYEEDTSAMGRINAWWFAYYLALDHPIVGGGFVAFRSSLFLVYAPNPTDFHDAHSIYFEVLGEHGFVGLGLFLTMGFLALRTGRWIMRHSKGNESLSWARDLAAMVQVSLVGYAVGGAFLGLAYFDLLYHLIAILVVVQSLVVEELAPDGQKKFTFQGGRPPPGPLVRDDPDSREKLPAPAVGKLNPRHRRA